MYAKVVVNQDGQSVLLIGLTREHVKTMRQNPGSPLEAGLVRATVRGRILSGVGIFYHEEEYKVMQTLSSIERTARPERGPGKPPLPLRERVARLLEEGDTPRALTTVGELLAVSLGVVEEVGRLEDLGDNGRELSKRVREFEQAVSDAEEARLEG